MGKRKQQVLTLVEAAKAPKRKRRTKKQMEEAKALSFAIKRTTMEAVYPAEGYPFALCPVCETIPHAQHRKRRLTDLEVKNKGQVFKIYRSIYPCSRESCKTDLIVFISATLDQKDILFFLDSKRLKGGKDRQKLPAVTRQNTSSIGQPNAQAVRTTTPDEAVRKRKKIKRKH